MNENYNDNDPRYGKTHVEVWHSVRNLSGLNNCGIHKLSNHFIPTVSPTKEKRVIPTKEKFGASTDKIVNPMKGTNFFFSPKKKKFTTSKVATPAVITPCPSCKRKLDKLIDLCHSSSKNGKELNNMGNHQPIKLSFFGANLKFSFVCIHVLR